MKKKGGNGKNGEDNGKMEEERGGRDGQEMLLLLALVAEIQLKL